MPEQQIVLEKNHTEITHANFAGFWIRFLAIMIDSFIYLFIYGISFTALFFLFEAINIPFEFSIIAGTIYTAAITIWYYILLPASEKQGTWGKQICNIYIGDQNGNRITKGRSTLRFICLYISSLSFYIGFIMAAFTDKKQGLHDMMASTYVYKK